MALDATVSGSSADSYVTVDDADEIAGNAGLTAWATKTDEEKEAALRRAAQELDAHRFHNGARAVRTQARLFPRQVDNGVILPEVCLAQVYQAEWIVVAGEADRKQWEGAKAAPIKDAGAGSPLCPRAFAILARFISRTGEYRDS